MVAGGHGAHHRERADVQRQDRRFCAACQHHVGPPGTDHVNAVPDRLRTGRAGADQGVSTGTSPDLDADPAGGAVRHQHRHRVRRDALPALLLEDVVGRQRRSDAADPAGDGHPETLWVRFRGSRVGPRLARCDRRQLLATVHPARLHAAHHLDRVDGGWGGDADRQLLRPRLREPLHAAAPGQHRRPGRRDIPAERGGRAEPGDDDRFALYGHAVPPAFLATNVTTSWTVVRSFSWSSGISTPNLSCAATAISTIDSESMSRSSTNVFSGVTWSAGTPATSSMISPRPARISCSVMDMCPVSPLRRFSSYWRSAPRQLPRGSWWWPAGGRVPAGSADGQGRMITCAA